MLAGVAPILMSVSIFDFCNFMVSLNVFKPRLTPVIEFPIIIPLMGIVYCGLKKLTPTTPNIKKEITRSPVKMRDRETIRLKRLLIPLFLDSTV